MADAVIAPSQGTATERGAKPGVVAPPRVWAFGGGKGGVGKSVVACNVAARMAQLGHRVVLVDGDLGGANLDLMLGCERPAHTLSHFFDRTIASLAEVAAPTAIDNLAFVAGDGDCLGAANPAHAQKQKLIRHLRRLPCDLVVVDLGAGTSFNTLDLYLAADLGVCVTSPEPTSLQNCFSFMKTAMLRETASRTATDGGTAANDAPPRAVPRPISLVVNRAAPAEARRVANLLHDLAGRFLGASVRLAGAVADDPTMARSVRTRQPLCTLAPESPAALDLDQLAQSLWRPPTPQRSSPRMGINEEIDHEGARFHVQTEDLGVPTCAVRTQVFRGDGSVVFTRRTAYVDAFFARLGAAPEDRVRLHHVAIVRALRAGRVEPVRRSA
ncbi:MAG: P-loop NTPase [Nannocystaceae bacterium]